MKALKLRLAACAAVVLGLVFAASAKTYYVDASRPDNNDDGLSEATAKRDISAAISSSAEGDVILVKPGTYTQTISASRELTIRSTDGAEKTFIFTENRGAVDISNGATTTMIDGFTLSSVGSSYAIWGGTFTNCVIAKCGGLVNSCNLQRSTVAYNDQEVRGAYHVDISDDCLVWGNPVKTETAPDPCFLDPENFDFRLRAFSPEAYTNPRLGYYQGPLVEGRFVRVAVDGAGELEGDLVNLVADGGDITLTCATTSPRPVVRWLDENGETIADGGDYELSADSLTIKNVTADRRITACFERKTWYVNADTGDDAGNDGLSEGAPFKTIAKALGSAVDLDTILVAAGTYVEGYDESGDFKYPKLSVTDGRRLTIRATGDRDATIIDGGSETSCLWLNDDQAVNTNVVVDGFTLLNGKASFLRVQGGGNVGCVGGGAFGGWLKNCRIASCSSDGWGGGAAHARLENCQVEDNVAAYQGGGLYYCEADRCRVLRNRLTGNAVMGAGVAAGTTANSLIAFNEIAETCPGACYGAGAAWGAKLYNCTVYANENNAPSYSSSGGGVDLVRNKGEVCNTIIYGNTCEGVPSEVSINWDSDYENYIKNCCTNDPSFKNAAGGDFSLKPTSVCHNAGKNGYVTGELDLAGYTRIQEMTVDLGAYEYCPIMTITAAPKQATAGTVYSYKLTQTGGEAPVAWAIDDVDEAKNTAAEVAESSTFAALGEKKFAGSGSQYWDIDLPFAFPYGGTTYTRAGISNYGAVTLLKDDSSILTYFGHSNLITDDTILSRPVILPYLALNWGTYGEDGCGIFVDQSVPQQMTIRWATYFGSDRYRANFSMTLYANGEIRFSYGEIASGYKSPSVVGLSFGDGEHYLDMLSSFGGSNANDILFHPLAIPEGISLDGDQLVGMPTKGGTYRFRVTATEAGKETQSKIVTMDVLSDYTIHFDANGAKTGTAPDDKALTSIEEYILPEPGMTCGCARFLGWATNATGAAVYQPGDKIKCLTAEPDATVTLYAAWENIFVLQFDGNASGVIGAHASYTNEIGATFNIYRDEGLQTNIVEHGERYMPCRVGWFLDNWNMCADGSGEKFLRNATSSQWSQSVSSESFGANRGDVITLHAQWFESDWDFYWADPQLGGGKWLVRLKGDEGAKLWSVYGAVAWPESLTLPASYRGRTVSSLSASLRSMNGDPAYAIGQIIVPEGYTNLAERAFWSLYHLESITFPSTLEVIPRYCCEDCTNLTSIGFSEGTRVVGYGAFTRCTALSAVELSLGLTNLEATAFYNCTNLTAVVLSPDYVGGTSGSYQFYNCPIAKLEIPASCQGFGSQSLNRTKALRFLGDLPSWNVYNANYQYAQLIEYPATNTTWNAGPIANYSTKPHKGFVGPVAAFDVTDAYFWTNANETVTFAYAESPLAETVTLPEGTISWGGVDWEIVGFEPDAFDGQPTTTIYYPISEYAKWEQVTPPEGITLAPAPGTFFTLTFHVNGGNPYVPANMTFPPNGTRALPSAAPTRSAYKFLGWATTADGAVAYQPGDDYTAGAAGASATLFAKWEEVGNYTIHFNGNSANATSVPADIVTAVGTTPAISDDPEREGWTFGGWTNAVNDHVYQAGEPFDEGCAKNTTFTLYAKWTSTTVYNLTYTDANGTEWTYRRTGDDVWVTAVAPDASVDTLTLPTSINGSATVQKANGFNLPEKIGGLWWYYQELADNKAKLLRTTLSGPTDLVLPSVIAGRTVVEFATVNNGLVNYRDDITSVEIPGAVKELSNGAFQQCSKLTRVVLHEGTEAIRDNAFLYDYNLATPIDFPSTLTDVSAYAFQDACANMPYDANGLQFADTGKTCLLRARADVDHAPEGVKTVAYAAFANTACTKITLPESVTKYGGSLFIDTETLEEVVFRSPASINSSYLFSGVETIKTVTFYGGAQNVIIASSPSHITTVGFLTTPPAWDVKTTFPDATTVVYDARYAAEWADYKAAHLEFEYVEVRSEEPTGQYLKTDLVEDLGIEIPGDVDYALGDKVTVKVEGLAKGLKVVVTPVYEDPAARKKVVVDYVYTIEGVPTEAIDFEQQPMYARVTTTYKDKTKGDKGKVETLQPIVLSIATPEPSVLTAGVLNEVYEPADIATLWPAVADAKVNPKDWTFKGWPAGLKYNATAKDASWSYKDGKATVRTNAEPWTVYGQPTKAGEYPITATWKHKLADGKTTVSETFSAVLTIWGDDGVTEFRYEDQAYVAPETKTLNATWKSFSGLPTGIKWTVKPVTTKNKDKSVTTNVVACSLYGTPTKPGVYAVTATKADPNDSKKSVKETFLWKVAEGENPGLGAAQVGWGDALVKYDGVVTRTATLLQGLAADFAVDASALAAGAKVTVSGLPSGLKYNAKTGKITGVATKAEKKVVTVKVVQNGVTVTKTFAIDVAANPFAGAYHGLFEQHVATAVITPAAGGTAKLVLDEYVPSKHKVVKYTATAKGFSMAEEYDPENSLYAGIVYEFTLKADAKNNPDFAAAERVLEVGLTGVSLGQGVVLGLGEVSLRAKDDPPSESGLGYVFKALTAADYAMFVEAGMKPPPVMAGIARDKAGRHLFSGAAVLDEKKLRYQVTGKLRDGTAVKALQPLCLSEGFWGAPSLFVEKGGDKRANVAMFAGFGKLNDDIGIYEYESFVAFYSVESVTEGEFNPFDTVSIHGTAAEEIGLLDQLLVLDKDELAAAGFEGEAPVFRFRVEEAFDLSKAKINIFAPDAKEGDQPLKRLSPVKLTASSGYVFKGSFKWNANVGGDGNTYSFELVPGLGFDESFLGRCEVKPASGASTVVTARLKPEIE